MVQTVVTMSLDWVQHTTLSAAIRDSRWFVMAFESVHLIGLALLGGSITLLAIRALHPGNLRALPLATLARELRALILLGLSLLAVSGMLIAISMPYKYYLNTAFRVKMSLLAFALTASVPLLRRPILSEPLWVTRVTAIVAWILWLGVGLSGRLIGFI
jgi:hypothetical protein